MGEDEKLVRMRKWAEESVIRVPTIEELKDSSLRLQFLTYGARMALKAAALEDLNLFWQCQIMELCHNYSVTKVISALCPGKDEREGDKPLPKRRGRKPAKNYFNKEDPKNPYVETCANPPMTVETPHALPFSKSHMSAKEFMESGHLTLRERLGEPNDNLSFSANAMYLLYLLDSKVLASDHRDDRLADLVKHLDGLGPEDIDELANSLDDKKASGIVLGCLAEKYADKEEAREQLEEQVALKREPFKKTKVTQEGIELLKNTLRDLETIKEDE
jgi:hypothetical protein